MKNFPKKPVFLALAGVMLMASASSLAECAYPKAPASVPNGNTATAQEMSSAAEAFKQYNADVTLYLACLQQETDSRSSGLTASMVMRVRSMQSKKHNAAIGELEASVEKFNAQVRAFKSR